MKQLASAIFPEESPFDLIFDGVYAVKFPEEIKDNTSALILWGGEDISPAIYGHKASKYTDAGERPSYRDRLEIELARAAIERNIPIIGICRGAQLMCALSGGTLIQHVTGHAGPSHDIETDEGKKLWTNSVHHQMMNPFKVDHKLIAWASPALSKIYIEQFAEQSREDIEKEPEVVWFPQTKSLCIQGHPEFPSATMPFIKYCLDLTKQYILDANPNP